MQDEQTIIEKLGIQQLAEDRRAEIVSEATMRIGEAITDSLSDEQFSEYEAITNDDHEVIDRWLEQNVPDFESNPFFQEIAADYENDPERNNPRKIFANLAWLEVNVPDLEQQIEGTLTDYKQELNVQGE